MEHIVRYTPVFEANMKAYDDKKYRFIANEGSTRSSKTVSLAQLLACYIPVKDKKAITIVSPSLPHLKRGARREFIKALYEAGIYQDSRYNKTDNIYNYPNGSYVEFFGVEDGNKVHGPGRDILWCNEMNLIPYDTYKQLAIRTNEVIFGDYNPSDEFSWVYTEADKPTSKVIHSTYLNNKGNLTKEIIDEIEGLKDADDNLWKVYGLGLRGTSSETIWTHWKIRPFPDDCEVVYGLDFGFNVPSALVKVGFKEGAVYVDEMIYQTKLTTGDIVDQIKLMNIGRTEVFYDTAEPKSGEELTRARINAKPASKKSVFESIRKVKSMPLYISPGSTNILKEIKSYKWRTDRDGKVLDEPVKFMDHAMDAIRYAVFTKLSVPKREWTVV